MMTADEIFAVWAPDHAPWSLWAKPVLFAQMDLNALLPQLGPDAPVPPPPQWLPAAMDKVALVIDCPGAYAVDMGMMAGKAGYRPVPLFNALPGPMDLATLAGPPPTIPTALVEVRPIMNALAASTDNLAALKLPLDAPPAFLLDANRRTGVGPLAPNRFDNRSVSFPTDFPSASYLLSEGIKRVLLIQMRAAQPQPDLAHTLLRWQEAGIEISSVGLENGAPQRCLVEKPSLFRVLWYRVAMLIGLRPQVDGFGGIIPEPSSG
jgi:hypothetical protein